MIQHPVFIRKIGAKAIVMTIIDTKSVSEFPDGDSFVIGKTDRSIYTGDNLNIALDSRTIMDSESFINVMSDNVGYPIAKTTGNTPDGILTEPIWFIRKSKSILEQMGA